MGRRLGKLTRHPHVSLNVPNVTMAACAASTRASASAHPASMVLLASYGARRGDLGGLSATSAATMTTRSTFAPVKSSFACPIPLAVLAAPGGGG